MKSCGKRATFAPPPHMESSNRQHIPSTHSVINLPKSYFLAIQCDLEQCATSPEPRVGAKLTTQPCVYLSLTTDMFPESHISPIQPRVDQAVARHVCLSSELVKRLLDPVPDWHEARLGLPHTLAQLEQNPGIQLAYDVCIGFCQRFASMAYSWFAAL